MLDLIWKDTIFKLVYGPLLMGLAILLSVDDRPTVIFVGLPLIAIGLVGITLRKIARRRAAADKAD
jgi:hypothetical protein